MSPNVCLTSQVSWSILIQPRKLFSHVMQARRVLERWFHTSLTAWKGQSAVLLVLWQPLKRDILNLKKRHSQLCGELKSFTPIYMVDTLLSIMITDPWKPFLGDANHCLPWLRAYLKVVANACGIWLPIQVQARNPNSSCRCTQSSSFTQYSWKCPDACWNCASLEFLVLCSNNTQDGCWPI